MKIFFLTAIALSILFPSCTPTKPNLVTCDLKRSDYTEVIRASGSIQAVNTVNIMAPMNYYGSMTVAWVIPEGSQVVQGDSICTLECAAMMQMLDQELRNLESQQADFKKLEADNALNRALLDARMKENKAGMAISQLDSVQIRFAPRVKQQLMALELEKSRIEEKKLQKKYEAEKKIDETEIRQLKSRIIQAENRAKSMQDKVKELTILAPKSGMIAKSESPDNMIYSIDGEIVEMGKYVKVGSQVYPRMSLMALPELTEMQVSVEVQEVDYKRIVKGQKVNILVDAVKDLRTTGSVKRKSLAAKNSYNGESKIKMYEVIVSVDSCHSRMPPGLSARCDIFVSQVRDTVVIPTLAIFEKDSLKIVYVAEGDLFRQITVETGLSNSSQTIITKGLVGNETISLVEPPRSFIEKPKNSTHE
jgi:macrolide-specific efflux system membrane fusion protein